MSLRLALALAFAISCGSPHDVIDASHGPVSDAPTPTGQLGDECSQHADCVSGYCVEAIGGVGGVCSRTCNDDCPTDWSCREVQGGVKVCVPSAPQLCLACASDAECGSDAACLSIDGTGSCATKCTTACPTGYHCATDTSGAHTGTYCQPVSGACSCTAAMNGATRACTSTNAIGTCFGTQTCSATGWSTCTAATASPEICDGIDNDCDFLIDNNVGGGQACTNTNAFGTCPGTRTCAGATGFLCEGQIPMAELCNYADDNCDGRADETFPSLGTLCSPGVGACQRFGSMRCNSAGSGTECSVTAGAPATEMCNGVDDDCDGNIDQTFITLGTACSAGLGVCTRYGTTICSTDGASTACSASAGTNSSTETCNYLDDNCDGFVDNGFRNAGGQYDTTANCGACGNDCATVFTGANSTGVCSTGGGSPQCAMVCNAGAFDLDSSTADGCEFVLDATAVYVSNADAAASDDFTCGLGPSNTGSGNHPCRTIGFGLVRAMTLARANVFVADGTYDEAVALVTGKNLFGGYRAGTWSRHLATTSTVIQGVASSGNHDRTVTAAGISNAIFEGFVVRGSNNTKPSGNSYAIYVTAGSASLVIRGNQIFAGRGGPGNAGTPGTNGLTGGAGLGALNDTVNGSYDGFITTSSPCTVSRQYANGGSSTCGLTNVSGGRGGGNRCPPASDYTQFSGINGVTASGGGGAGGQGGFDGTLQIQGGSSTCFLPTPSMAGADGSAGSVGTNGGAGGGCASAAGMIAGNEWVNGTALSGNAGANGVGGGGGGGGGGGRCTQCTGSSKQDRLGAHGGGGGGGGCGGSGGGAGASGGGVFGIFIVGGAPPSITGNTIQRGAGGTAGDGGIGGAGGLGGNGGAGGGGTSLCSAKGGRGGDGGNAGHGSGGGGGCGGSSFGIFTSGLGAQAYCGSNTVSGGSAGLAGAGGYSGGNSGAGGAAGQLQACVSL